MRRIALDRYIIQERANGVSIIHRDSEKEWRFNVDEAAENEADVLRRKESMSQADLNEHSDESSDVHGIAENDAVAGIADIMREIQNHSDEETGIHGIGVNDSIATREEIEGKADVPHGDDAHSVNYAKNADLLNHNSKQGGVHGIPGNERIATVRQVERRADSPHGNEEHDPDFATLNDLDGKADATHGNESHDSNYITGINALSDETNIGSIDSINFRDNFSVQRDDGTLTVDSQGGVSSSQFTSHTEDDSAHHSRYTDQEALAAVSGVTGDLVGLEGGRISGPIIQEHGSDLETHGWTHLGNVPRSDSTAYLLIAPVGPGVRMVGTLVGVRGNSTNRSYANIGISFGSNTSDNPIANGTVTRLEAWSAQDPTLDFKIVEYNGTDYYTLELQTTNYTNYSAGIYFSGLLRSDDTGVVDVNDVTNVRETSIMNNSFEVGNETVYHTGNVNPVEEGHDHSGETVRPQRVEADEIVLPTYPDGQGQGSIWLVE